MSLNLDGDLKINIFFFKDTMASRLTLNCNPSYVCPQEVNDLPTTVISVWDDSALSQQVKRPV
jgi:hypothetical protein